MIKTLKAVYAHDFVGSSAFSAADLKYFIANVIVIAVPLLFAHPQIVVGAIVNFVLIYVAMNFKGGRLIPIVILPSLAVLLRGILFGPLTYYVLIFAPFIWLANAIFVMGIRYFLMKKWTNYWSFGMSALLKTAFLFSIALIFVNLFKFPAMFLQAMGALQLGTALIAGVVYLGLEKVRKI
ncbi:MAG: hypothetical protein US89_C0008G0024 [Candidatus Peregrinibacteria bacterium GW2011_GWF2_38_29]|nr:MAG: hypothetical protein US89_C0008G0024 [Candidatus Peregrinibacteria bacterium GW2011_GWF2_38_29]HBB03165.1 hypothetical protein [Candidatus Peregrinibacteria bacterium]